ncbi:MAG: aminotransferase class I/II-fold pyridoxal phosphate-dependent enzyme [Lachnospiraceae bacterium]|nr:aminotransferase class I/II-fold pyridoxal phosphate-dependent enzyme [Lachnospiraceae bacterium]
MTIHGGDIYRNRVKLDFSINVNPLGVPDSVKDALYRAVDRCDVYPDGEVEKLKNAVGGFLAVSKEYLLFGNGASELFMAAVHGIKPKKTVIPVPSFYGYEYAAKAAESEILFYETKEENSFCVTEELISVLTEDVDLLFLANPNNPDGSLRDRESVKVLLRHCKEKGIYMVLDESFIAFCGDGFSMLFEIEEFDNLLLVGSFTKIFSIPGVRLGYLVCKNQRLLAEIAGQLPEWNLSCFAQEAGCICAEQTEFIRQTEQYITKERQFLEEGLREKGFVVFPSKANFILLYSEEPLYERLLKKGILIRDCSNFRGLHQGFYRIAVRSRKENKILLRAMGIDRPDPGGVR